MTRKERWQELKQQYPNAILLFGKGDFYEAFAEDAAKVGGIVRLPVKQHRKFKKVCRLPLIGVRENYLPQLVRAGLSVVIIDEL